MSIQHGRAWKSHIVSVVLAASALVAASWLAPGGAGVASAGAGAGLQAGGQKVSVFEDVTVGPGDSWDNVVVIGGDLVIEGTVGDNVVVVGGNLVVRAGASVGHGPSGDPGDAAIVSVFGDITIDPGAELSGRVVDVAGGIPGGLKAVFADPVMRPWTWVSVAGWLAGTAFLFIVTLIITAIAPRQVAFVRDRARRHFFSSLGWGALGGVLVPVITVLLFATIIGVLFVAPWLFIVLPVMLLFGLVSMATLLGGLIAGRGDDGRGRVMAAAAIGMAILCVVRFIPVAGAIILFLAFMVGFGATYTAIWQWRREARGATAQRPAESAGDERPPG